MRRTVSFRSVLWGVAKRDGQVPESNDLTPDIAVQMTEGINTAYRYAWEYYDWPEACDYLQFTPQSSASTLTAWVPYTVMHGEDQVQLATIFGVWEKNPLVYPNGKQVPYQLGQDGIYFGDPARTEPVWIRFRAESPTFNAVEWDPGLMYGYRDVVYYSVTGHCYELRTAGTTPGLAPGASDVWRIVPLLSLLADAVKAGAFAIYLGGDGQAAASGMLETAMNDALDTQVCLLHDQMEVHKNIRR
jgi:hypothetical protein